MLLLQGDTSLLLNGDNCIGDSSGSMIISLKISSVVSVFASGFLSSQVFLPGIVRNFEVVVASKGFFPLFYCFYLKLVVVFFLHFGQVSFQRLFM